MKFPNEPNSGSALPGEPARRAAFVKKFCCYFPVFIRRNRRLVTIPASAAASAVMKPIPRAEFDEIFARVERWGLDQFAKERSFEKLTYTGA